MTASDCSQQQNLLALCCGQSWNCREAHQQYLKQILKSYVKYFIREQLSLSWKKNQKSASQSISIQLWFTMALRNREHFWVHRTASLKCKTAKERDGALRASRLPVNNWNWPLAVNPLIFCRKRLRERLVNLTKNPWYRNRNDPETISNAYNISLESRLESWLTHWMLKMTKEKLLLLRELLKARKHSPFTLF